MLVAVFVNNIDRFEWKSICFNEEKDDFLI